ncbi:cathepsin B-like [Dysidea avara]|uniref:cathepsin B-like n=1 Tax=Dysidea avara TaxID=196820 RepID=UPI003316CD53
MQAVEGSTINMLQVLLLLLALAAYGQCEFDTLSQEFFDYIESLNTTWKAGQNFPGKSIEDVKNLCGTLEPIPNDPLDPGFDSDPPLLDIDALPSSFDCRSKWPQCTSIINIIGDQDDCGSCWAFGSSSAINDRHCIYKGQQLQLSAQFLTTCCAPAYRYNGCGGAQLSTAYDCWRRYGLPTGGQYGSNYGCQPYTIKDCSHAKSNDTLSVPDCHDKQTSYTPPCSTSCRSGYPYTVSKDKHYGYSYYKVPPNWAAIASEIYLRGSVTLTYKVYEDFVSYKSGVYKYAYGKFIGYHAVKVFGWGYEGNVPYWLVSNSWGATWGDHGFFKILRGYNNCGIESSGMAGIPYY